MLGVETGPSNVKVRIAGVLLSSRRTRYVEPTLITALSKWLNWVGQESWDLGTVNSVKVILQKSQ